MGDHGSRQNPIINEQEKCAKFETNESNHGGTQFVAAVSCCYIMFHSDKRWVKRSTMAVLLQSVSVPLASFLP